MQTVKYKFADGTVSETEVSDELYKEIDGLNKADKSNNRAHTRRQISLDGLCELGVDPAVYDEHDCGDAFQNIRNEMLYNALQSLDAKQKDLVYKVFYERRRLKEIARDEKVTTAAISARLQVILERLRLNM